MTQITRSQLKEIERYADALFQEHGIDIEFQDLYKGTHFFDRINDPRNQSPISLTDLKLLFAKVSMKYGDELGMESPGSEGVLKDMRTNVNLPFILKWDSKNRELDLVPKTIMKKKNFVSKGNEYRVENRSMKLVEIYRDIKKLNEIGDRIQKPPSGIYDVGTYDGKIKFVVDQLEYTIEIKVPTINPPKISLVVDFYTGDENNDMTNAHAALKVLSYIVGGVEEWLKRYKEYVKTEKLEVVYLRFNPKSENDEMELGSNNRRSKLYQAFIKKFASNYGSDVQFTVSGGKINATFIPELKI
jgi:hypothetical protein